jgi:hypothetical protein
MSDLIGWVLGKFQKAFKLYHKELIHIEGGLGSQILGAINFWNLQSKIGKSRAKCDLSYFSVDAQQNGLWPYSLDKYGISISQFEKFERKSRINLIKGKRDFLSESELSEEYWINARKLYLNKFSYDRSDLSNYFSRFPNLKSGSEFGAIHIRRGDYLKVASKVIAVEDYLGLINSVGKLFPIDVVILSDSEISQKDRESFRKAFGENHSITYFDQPDVDPFHAHCLLRESSFLITSNSTYSFSAGLLGKSGQKVFSPMTFHAGSNSERYNRTFRAAGAFFIWPMKD